MRRKVGHTQLEPEVAAKNDCALALYRNEGFTEYGRNPMGFNSRLDGLQEIVLMRRMLDG